LAGITKEEINILTDKLMAEHAVDFRDYKPTTLGRRIQRRLDATKCPDVASYMRYLESSPDEYAKLIDSILINVTDFFRDPEAWEVVKSEVIPSILAQKRPGDQIRIWSAGCATGEEAYTIAMLMADALGARVAGYDVRIYATDIDEGSLAVARRGKYSEESVKSVPEAYLKYFIKNTSYTITRDIRRMVIFGRHNLVNDAPISHADFIACRNVLIYMSVDLQSRILSKFHYGLDARGFLFLGRAESLLTASRLFDPVTDKWRIFRKESPLETAMHGLTEQQAVAAAMETGRAEYQLGSLFNEALLRYTPSGIIGMDVSGNVRVVNSAAERLWGIRADNLLGKPLAEAKLPPALQSLRPRITQAKRQRAEQAIDEMDLSQERGRPFHISVTLAPLTDVMGSHLGLIIVAEDITDQVRLRENLEGVNEQFHAANEELETTNEELQSTNEELETTNEELQSTNEELETTNEELQSTNEELETTNDELNQARDQLEGRNADLETLNENLKKVAAERDVTEQELHQVYEREHRIADTLQHALLTPIERKVGNFQVATGYRAAFAEALVGGDFCHGARLPGNRYQITLGDVSGKGLEAAVYAYLAKYMNLGFVFENPEPDSVLARLNDALSEYGREGQFVTMAYLLLDLKANVIHYASAGHEPAIHRSAETGKVAILPPTGQLLGAEPGAEYAVRQIEMQPNDLLILYTDGLSEAGPREDMLGTEGITRIVSEHGSKSPAQILGALYETATSLSAGKLTDDAACILIKRTTNKRIPAPNSDTSPVDGASFLVRPVLERGV
jgi:two-component system CheB/CheR fusion protein